MADEGVVTVLKQHGTFYEECSRCGMSSIVFMVETCSFRHKILCIPCIKEKYRHKRIDGLDMAESAILSIRQTQFNGGVQRSCRK